MKSKILSHCGLIGLGFVIGAIGCSSGGGGSSGSGGNSSGSGGKSASGGSNGSGGAASSGGTTGSGGLSASGGATGSGGSSTGGSPGTGGTTGSGGSTNSGGTTASGGNGSGGNGSGGTASGGSTGTGGGTAGAGSGGTTGSGGGGGSISAWTCPAASTLTGSPIPSGASPTRIAGAPPTDTFNMYGFGNVEGPVWIGDSLYVSEMLNGGNPIPQSRILKITSSDVVSVFISDSGLSNLVGSSGSNGMAVDPAGNLVTANHGVGGIVSYSMPGKMATVLISSFNGKRFTSPNDLAITKDGSKIYFSDPDWQNSTGNGQSAKNVYQFSPGVSPATATIITDYTNEPNGVTLNLAETALYVDGGSGVKKYPITGGVVSMTGAAFGPSDVANATDGMALDCADNLYVAVSNSANVVVVSPSGTKIGTITIPAAQTAPSAVTNVAFGGSDHQTLYITGQGNPGIRGVFKVHLNFPGMPY